MADLVLPSSLAVWDPLGGTPEPLMTGHDGIGIHTMAGTFAGTDHMFHQDGWGGTESTVGVAGSGFCKQWTPWNRQADAMLDGNGRWVSVECADFGEGFPPASTASDTSPPLTDAQVDRIVALCVYWCDVRNHAKCPSTWACHKVGIPPVFVTSSCARGIAGHRAGIDPWRPAGCPHWSMFGGKICPRKVRLDQVQFRIVPRVAAALGHTTPPLEDELPTYHTIRCSGQPPVLRSTTGIYHVYDRDSGGEAALKADAERLDRAKYVHGTSIDCGTDVGAYHRLTDPAPLMEADLLRIAASLQRGLNTDPAEGPDGLFVPNLVETARRGAEAAK